MRLANKQMQQTMVRDRQTARPSLLIWGWADTCGVDGDESGSMEQCERPSPERAARADCRCGHHRRSGGRPLSIKRRRAPPVAWANRRVEPCSLESRDLEADQGLARNVAAQPAGAAGQDVSEGLALRYARGVTGFVMPVLRHAARKARWMLVAAIGWPGCLPSSRYCAGE